ncbi:IBR finger domain-containing protein [Ophiocordyceps sinensis CO18]|uniref:IBR finger domain-containing protein n=1 Tax=Ophiocordyceps sinensis (strain Co18 / CGMCC 3.14243) TaxID=911162 RepID=T5APC2_OPHSC|nr:IBR finger domain-containing protein [Ophiocordyceps sinensis CO18]
MADPNLELEARRRALLLRLAEMETVERGEKAGKRKRDSADSDLALEMYLQEIEDSIALERDEAMSRSIAQAVGSDGDLVQGLLAEQDQNASVLNQDGPPRENANKDGTTAQSAAGDSATHEHMETRRCTACADSFAANRLAMCPCSHEYCYGCLSSLFMHATVDESLFPPRCCQQPIPVDDHVYALGSTLINRFKTKAVEFSTPNRTYCHDPNCATFVPPRFIRGRVATCGRCKAETCVSCKGASHDKDCPQDKSMHDMLLMAKENGWQRCYNCHRLVELGVGCNHMSTFAPFIPSFNDQKTDSGSSLHLPRSVLLCMRHAMEELFLPGLERDKPL